MATRIRNPVINEVYDPFIGILRERHPETPIVSITPIYAVSETKGSQRNEQMRALIRKVVSRRVAAGDTHLQLVEGADLLGPSRRNAPEHTPSLMVSTTLPPKVLGSAFSSNSAWPR